MKIFLDVVKHNESRRVSKIGALSCDSFAEARAFEHALQKLEGINTHMLVSVHIVGFGALKIDPEMLPDYILAFEQASAEYYQEKHK